MAGNICGWIKSSFVRTTKKCTTDAGEYWKTFLLGGGVALTRDNLFSTPQTDYALAIDEHRTQTNVVLPLREGYDIRVNVGLDLIGSTFRTSVRRRSSRWQLANGSFATLTLWPARVARAMADSVWLTRCARSIADGSFAALTLWQESFCYKL